MASQPTILVTSAGGNIGLELTPLLLKGDAKLVFVTSNAEQLWTTFPALADHPNATVEEGSIKHPQFIEAIIKKHSVTSVFLTVSGADELLVTLGFWDAMERAGSIKHLVWISGTENYYVSQPGLSQLLKSCSSNIVLTKAILEQKLAFAGFPWATTILGPSIFFTNDMLSLPPMLEEGFYSMPLGEKVGCSRVSTSDIALAARNAFQDPAKWDRKVHIGSLRRYRGSETARYWGEALGRQIRVCDHTDKEQMLALENTVASFAPYISGVGEGAARGWGRTVGCMYETFAEHGFGMTEEDHAVQVELLGKEPEDYESWVAEQGRKALG
ncbi:hypothetical protein MBLNU230_g5766t1 [Neophaeotheca triangularis]